MDEVTTWALDRTGRRTHVREARPGHVLIAQISRAVTPRASRQLVRTRREIPWAPLVLVASNGATAFLATVGALAAEVAARGLRNVMLQPFQPAERLGQPAVESLQRRRIAGDVAPVTVQGVEVDEIGEDEIAVARLGPLRGPERFVAIVFGMAALFWRLRDPLRAAMAPRLEAASGIAIQAKHYEAAVGITAAATLTLGVGGAQPSRRRSRSAVPTVATAQVTPRKGRRIATQ